MTITKHHIRPGAYYDSVVLMQLQRGLLGLPGVLDAGVVMATPANRELLAANNLLPDSVSASPDDMLIVVKADEEKSAVDAISKVDGLLTRRKSSNVSEDFRPRILRVAIEVDEDVDAVLGNLRCGFLIAQGADVGPMVYAVLYPDLRWVGARDPAIVGKDFEVLPIVRFQHVRHAESDGVLAQVRRHISDAKFLSLPALRTRAHREPG